MRRLLVGVAVLVCVGVAAPAWAQSSAVRDARRHMEDGQELFLQERWGEAAAEFLAAFELRPHTAFLYNAALAYHRLGECPRPSTSIAGISTRRPTPGIESASRRASDCSSELPRRAAAAEPPPEQCTGEDCPEPPEVSRDLRRG